MKKIQLLISVCFPLIVFFVIILLANDFALLIQAVFFYLITQSFILFQYSKNNWYHLILRVIFSLIITVGLGFLVSFFTTELLNINLNNDFKIGIITGLLISTYFNYNILLHDENRVEAKAWLFANIENSMQEGKFLILKLTVSFIIIALVIFIFQGRFGIGFLILALILLLIAVSLLVIKNHHFVDHLPKLFLIGSVLVLVSPIMMLFQAIEEALLVFLFLVGATLIQYKTSSLEVFRSYILSVFIPCIIVSAMILFNHSNFLQGVDIYLINANNSLKKELITKQRLIEYQLNTVYKELSDNGNIHKSIKPNFTVQVKNNNSIWQKTDVDLELTFSYEIVGEPKKDSIKFYEEGEYLLNDKGTIAYAVALTFKQSAEKYLFNYFQLEKKVKLELTGTADSLWIKDPIPYYDKFDDYLSEEPNNTLLYKCENRDCSISKNSYIKDDNCTLAMFRALGVREFIERDLELLKNADIDYNYNAIFDKKNAGGKYRKVEIKMTIINITSNKND